MVRTKKIYREHLLNGAYQLVVNEGFKHFHARNVAKQIQCSTQPIYREFKNLTEFKDSLCEFVISKMENFFKKYTIDSLETLAKVINDYGKKYPKEFQRFFIEDTQCSERVEKYIHDHFDRIISESDEYPALSQEQRETLFKLFWHYIIGKTTLVAHQERDIQAEDNLLDKLHELYPDKTA